MDDDTMARDAAGPKPSHGYQLFIRIFLEVKTEKRARILLDQLGDGCAIGASMFHVEPSTNRPRLYTSEAAFVLPWDMRPAMPGSRSLLVSSGSGTGGCSVSRVWKGTALGTSKRYATNRIR